MASFSKMVLVRAPASLVWRYLENPLQVAAMSDVMVDVQNVQPRTDGGYDCTIVYDVQGETFEVDLETVEYVRNQRLVTRTRRGVESAQTWTISQVGAVTEVNVNVEYHLDVPLLGRLAANVAARLGETDIERILYRLKDNCEAVYNQTSGAPPT